MTGLSVLKLENCLEIREYPQFLQVCIHDEGFGKKCRARAAGAGVVGCLVGVELEVGGGWAARRRPLVK